MSPTPYTKETAKAIGKKLTICDLKTISDKSGDRMDYVTKFFEGCFDVTDYNLPLIHHAQSIIRDMNHMTDQVDRGTHPGSPNSNAVYDKKETRDKCFFCEEKFKESELEKITEEVKVCDPCKAKEHVQESIQNLKDE